MVRRTLLVVDDSNELRQALSFVLEDAGYRVMQAATGEEAVRMARVTRPDLILLDLVMPGMNGWMVREELRRSASMSSVPVMALTALDLRDLAGGLREAAFCAYVSKPVRRIHLLEMVDACIRGAAEGRQWTELPLPTG